jgi:hypothetical protein
MAERKKSGSDTRSSPSAAHLEIDSHRLLLGKRKAIIAALVEDPSRGKLLFANASLAFKDAGVELSPGISNHVLHTVRQSKSATTQRERLTAQLQESLGEKPHPSDPAWLARTLFAKLGVTALDTSGRDPAYEPAIPEAAQERLRQHLAPPSRPRLPARRSTVVSKPALFRLDLDAQVPDLEPAAKAPKAVSLPELWFYLDAHDLVRPLLELGILEVSVLPTLTREQYAAVRAGRPTGGFLDWVSAVSFPDDRLGRRQVATGSDPEVPLAKATAKKATAKKATAKKATAKKATAKKATAKKATGSRRRSR